jgi:glycosyltransferase involved in cell wall biosynthesis
MRKNGTNSYGQKSDVALRCEAMCANITTDQRDFVVVASEKWESGNQTSKHHIVRQLLSRGSRVLYVENISMRSFGSEGARDFNKAWRVLRKFAGGRTAPLPGLHCVAPIYLPFPKLKVAAAINKVLVPWYLRRHLKALKMKSPVYLYFMPTGIRLQGRLGESVAAYYIVDNYAAFADVEQSAMRDLEAEALKRADVVFATAQTLVNDRSALREDIIFSPHGVDIEHFAAARREETVVPADMGHLPKPRIGFMGSIPHDSVDLQLLVTLARARRDFQIVLFGRPQTDISCLVAEPNIHYLGPKKYEELPGYLKGLDVALIPFLVNDLTRDLNPIKLREYLAAGLPVVSTDLPAMRPFAANVSLVLGADGFESAIDAVLADPPVPEVQQAAVADASWEARVDAVLDALNAALEKKNAKADERP